MNSEEIQSLIKQLKAAGLGDEEIMGVFYETFEKGEMDRQDLEVLAEAMGYELTDDFKNDPNPDPIASNDAEGMSKEDLEDAKAIEPGESAEEFKDKIDDLEPVEGESEESSEEPSESEEESTAEEGEEISEEEPSEPEESEESSEDEEDDWHKAEKMFRV